MPNQNTYTDAHQRALEYLRQLTPEEHTLLLQQVGILDAAGQLAERYRVGGEPVGETASAPSAR